MYSTCRGPCFPTTALTAALMISTGCSSAPPTSKASGDWSGRYVYEYGGGRNVAATNMVVTYTLTLDRASCHFSAEGYQTDETILCATRPIPGGIDVTFKSYGDGKVTDKYGNAVYSPGDPLFSLEQGGGRLPTHWEGYPLPDEKPHPKAVYFKR